MSIVELQTDINNINSDDIIAEINLNKGDSVNEKKKLTDSEKEEVLQKVMDTFYNIWNDECPNCSQSEVCDKLDENHIMCYIVALGNFNYQVCNGGLSQWLFNSYYEFGFNRIREILSKLLNYKSEEKEPWMDELATLILKEFKKITDAYNVNDESWEGYCDECDGSGELEEDDNETGEYYTLDCPCCGGTGEVQFDNLGEALSAHGYSFDEFDSNFYKYEFINLIYFIYENFEDIMKESTEVNLYQNNKVNMSKPRVKLVGEDGNVFNLIGICLRTARRAKMDSKLIDQFKSEVTAANNYDEALQIMMKYFDIN